MSVRDGMVKCFRAVEINPFVHFTLPRSMFVIVAKKSPRSHFVTVTTSATWPGSARTTDATHNNGHKAEAEEEDDEGGRCCCSCRLRGFRATEVNFRKSGGDRASEVTSSRSGQFRPSVSRPAIFEKPKMCCE